MTCSDANNYCGLCTDHLFFCPKLQIRFYFCGLTWIDHSEGDVAPSLLSSNLPFFFLLFIQDVETIFWSAVWSYTEDNVTCFSCGDECRSRRCFWESFSYKMEELEKRKSSTPASIKPVNAPPDVLRSHLNILTANCSAYHLTITTTGAVRKKTMLRNMNESQLLRLSEKCSLRVWSFHKDWKNGKEIQILGGKRERRGVACVCSALICFAKQKILFKVWQFGKYAYSLSGGVWDERGSFSASKRICGFPKVSGIFL